MSESSNYKDHLYALILAGGGGTRLWPRSRNATPKQFLKLFNKQTLTQITSYRFNEILPWERIFCVTVSEEYKKEIIKEVPEFIKENILVEPARRETGPAHGLGATYIYKKDPDAVIMTEAADRLVEPVHRYLTTMKESARVAYEERVLIAMGVKIRYPHTGLGHIKRGKHLKKVKEIDFYKLDKFVEKPELALAKRYTSSGDYYWNAGEFVWRADQLLEELAKYEPEVGKALGKISEAIGTHGEKEEIEKQYKLMPKIAIDYAIAERSPHFMVVEGDFFWTDIGDWKEVWENLSKDELGNVVIDGDEPGGELINIDTSDALIHKNGRTIALIDVDNIVVVDTKDALLICSKSRAQKVKDIVNIIKEKQEKLNLL